MTESEPPPRQEKKVSTAVTDRRAREGARLRENLRRRKEQARARGARPGVEGKRDDGDDDNG